MGIVNLAVGRMMSQKAVFADFVNGTYYKGEQILHPEDLEHITTHRGYVTGKRGEKKAQEYDGDVRMRADFGTYSIIFAEENQDLTHYAMPLRCMSYEVEEYREQWNQMRDSHKKAKELHSSEEVLSGLKYEDRFAPVVSTVLFTGERWKGPKDLYDMLDFGDEEDAEFWKQYIPNYRMNLIKVSEIEDPEVFRTSLRHVFSLAKHRNDGEKFEKYFIEHREELDAMGSIAEEALVAILGESKRIAVDGNDLSKPEGEGQVCKAIDEMLERRHLLGKTEGISLGRSEGRLEGKIESAKSIAGNLSKLGYSVHETAKLCDIPLEMMQEWFAEWALEG